MYFCGPYGLQLRARRQCPYVVSWYKRYFESLGYRVTLVENITDIDDKIIQRANAEGRSVAEVGAEFAQAIGMTPTGWG